MKMTMLRAYLLIMIYTIRCLGWGEFFYEPDWLDGRSAELALTFFYQVLE